MEAENWYNLGCLILLPKFHLCFRVNSWEFSLTSLAIPMEERFLTFYSKR